MVPGTGLVSAKRREAASLGWRSARAAESCAASLRSQVIVLTYLGLAIALSLVAWVVWARRNCLQAHRIAKTPIRHAFGLLRQPRFGFGALGIFFYVGAEVAIGSVIVKFLMQQDVLGLSAQANTFLTRSA
jgi:MFS transporter, FHS family, L-fucose permease